MIAKTTREQNLGRTRAPRCITFRDVQAIYIEGLTCDVEIFAVLALVSYTRVWDDRNLLLPPFRVDHKWKKPEGTDITLPIIWRICLP